mmetsp:Transcript_32032/g.77824  ORF Transcript_32032/g.77824 Transcript_32032/m.77824 type:complete len:387 (-) Transcript_32032:3172-4332(-)
MMRKTFASALLILLISFPTAISTSTEVEPRLCHSPELYDDFPMLCQMLDRLHEDGDALADELTAWAAEHKLLVGEGWDMKKAKQLETTLSSSATSKLPVVFAHGMGDSCFNSGFQNLVKHTSSLLNDVYSVCIPTGKDKSEDTTNGYLLNMDASVDVFAESVKADPKLKDGFHAIGLSQGNNVIRGYITRYNEPSVDTFISINGVNAGTGALPNCFPDIDNQNGGKKLGSVCSLLTEQASKRAYTDFYQQHNFQANYWRDPKHQDEYRKFSQLARWNNEGEPFNQTFVDNFGKTEKFVWVRATKDGMVWPSEGEHWGAPDPAAPFKHILPRNETEWYITNSFGLKTAEEAGKNHYISFDGDHLQFSMEEYTNWVNKYLGDSETAPM